MVDSQIQFDRRVQRLEKKHQAMSRGYTARMRKDGLIVLKPRRARPGISLRSVVLFAVAFFVFKGFLLANLGPESYGERINRLNSGTPVEVAGAWIMQPDPVTVFVADQMGPVLR